MAARSQGRAVCWRKRGPRGGGQGAATCGAGNRGGRSPHKGHPSEKGLFRSPGGQSTRGGGQNARETLLPEKFVYLGCSSGPSMAAERDMCCSAGVFGCGPTATGPLPQDGGNIGSPAWLKPVTPSPPPSPPAPRSVRSAKQYSAYNNKLFSTF